MSHWRTVIFTFVLLLASTVAACSLFLHETSTATAGCCTSGTATILALFAIGFSVPFAALTLGVAFGRTTTPAQKAPKPRTWVAGVGLVGMGLWMLAAM